MISLVFLSVVSLVTIIETDITEARPWSRTPGAVEFSRDETVQPPQNMDKNAPVMRIVHNGQLDWAISEGKRVPVKAGEKFDISSWIKLEGTGTCEIGVVLRDAEGEAVRWSFGGAKQTGNTDWKELKGTFIVPRGIASIEPRLIGYEKSTVHTCGFSLKKTGKYEASELVPGESLKLHNDFLEIECDRSNGNFSVTDLRTKRRWEQDTGSLDIERFLASMERTESGTIRMKIVTSENPKEYELEIALEKDVPEFIVSINGEGQMTGNLSIPGPFRSKEGDRLIIPMNEGLGVPVEEENPGFGRLVAYGGHGICMAFWGQIEDSSGSGMMGILETPDDASIETVRFESEKISGKKLLGIKPLWEPSRKEFRYPRKIRYVFFENGSHIAVCKRYREHAKQIGLFVPFSEKVKHNSNIDKLLGAANIWCWDSDRLGIVRELQEAGIDRILWSAGGKGDELRTMNEMSNVLTSRYDIYQDIMDPERFPELRGVHGDWVTEAWPDDINWTSPDGVWRKGWAVESKEPGKRISCAVICDSKALPYAQKRISEELKEKPYKARFIDTTVAAPWFECEHPDHPMSRSDSRKHKMDLLKLIGDFGLVCGSETGHDASVPYCDFFEGMLSLGNYRVHESGRNMIQIIEDVPPQIERFQVNEKVRLPLWELVYHDCVVAMWYWGDYNNKLPKVWRKRDLFNALYGTPPMYMFTKNYWRENKENFVESYRTSQPVSRASAYKEMIDHRILNPKRTVQQTVFEGGLIVTVNFGETPFELPDGSILQPLDWKMQQ